ncbi:MAG: CpsD/CapB family tyrosine-protein kinase [Clostridia bacterium]|nr:CpsD/CapB family tyrosine-protein kinase [Clostridia bacterium]
MSLIRKNTKNSSSSKSGNTLDGTAICEKMNFAASEAYKRLRTNILFSFADNTTCRVVGITSALRGEGKSVTAINTAYTMALNGKKVLLIDADMRIPSISKKLDLNKGNGLSNLLVGLDKVTETFQRYNCSNSDIGFDIIPAGDLPPNPAELLGSKRMSSLLNSLKQHYDYIFIDLPPICAVSDALIVSKVTDGMIVVVRQDYCRTDTLKDTVNQLEFVEANIIGFVYNGASDGSGAYGKYGKYGKNSKYSKYYSKYYGSDYKTPESYEKKESK